MANRQPGGQEAEDQEGLRTGLQHSKETIRRCSSCLVEQPGSELQSTDLVFDVVLNWVRNEVLDLEEDLQRNRRSTAVQLSRLRFLQAQKKQCLREDEAKQHCGIDLLIQAKRQVGRH